MKVMWDKEALYKKLSKLWNREAIKGKLAALDLKTTVWSIALGGFINNRPWFSLCILLALLAVPLTATISREPYKYDGEIVLTVEEITQLSIDEDWTFSLDYEYYSGNNIILPNEIPVKYFGQYSKHASLLGGKLKGVFGFGHIALNIIYVLSLLAFGYCVFRGVQYGRQKLKGMKDKVAKIRQLEWCVSSDRVMPVIVTKAPQFDNTITGMLGVREWGINNGTLLSPVKGNQWHSSILISHQKPEAKNLAGVYSNVLVGTKTKDTSGNAYTFCQIKVKAGTIFGIIENRGVIIEHGDGILRSEYARILFLIINEANKNIAEKLSVRYEIPVVVTSGILLLDGWPIERKEIIL